MQEEEEEEEEAIALQQQQQLYWFGRTNEIYEIKGKSWRKYWKKIGERIKTMDLWEE